MAKKTEKPTVKSFSFKPEYAKELEYIRNMHNASDYVCRLIRRDMTIGEEDVDAKVKKLVKEYIANMVIMPQVSGTPDGGASNPKQPEEAVKQPEVVIPEEVLDEYM